MKSLSSPMALVLIGIFSVQFGASVAKGLFAEASPTTIVWLRLATSALVLWLVARPRLRGRSRVDWLSALGLGLSLALMNWSVYQSFARLPLGIAVTIEFLGPLCLAVACSRHARDFVWALLAALGVGLLGFKGGDLNAAGILYALFAGAMWAAYILLSAQVGRRWQGVDGLAVASASAALLVTAPAFACYADQLAQPKICLTGSAVGILSSVIPYTCELIALRSLRPAVFGVLMSMEPAVAALAGALVLHEYLALVQCLAILCVIIASIGATRSS